MKIKNGDKVKLKDGLVVGESYDGIVYLDSMTQFEDKVFTATEVDEKNRSCRILDSKYYPFTYSFAMLELVEYSTDDLLNYLLANNGKTKEQLVEEYRCIRETKHSRKALVNFFDEVTYSIDFDSCSDCMIENLCINCNDNSCRMISVLKVLKRNNLLDFDRFNDVFGYDDDDKEGEDNNE